MIVKSLLSACMMPLLICACSIIVQKAIGQSSLIDSTINPSSLRQLVQVLASDSFQGRFTGTEQAVLAAEFIAEEFNKAGASPLAGNSGYLMPFVARSDSQIGFNVLAALKGNS